MVIGAIIRGLVDLCFPWTCAACRAGFEGAGPLCAKCADALSKLEGEPCCGACAMPLPMHRSPCPYCMGKGPVNFDRVARLAGFEEPVRVMIHHLKYHRRWGMGEELAERMLAREGVRAVLAGADVLVPVPLHWRRQIPRGYNQAEVIARRLARGGAVSVVRAVRRVRHTEQQTRLHSAARRAENLKDAFALAGRAAAGVTGKRVVIVDDVWTTGATMHAVARVLKGAKPRSIAGIVVAVARPRGVERAGRSEEELDA